MEKKYKRYDSSLSVNRHFALFFNYSVLTAHAECLMTVIFKLWGPQKGRSICCLF
jgi:hypothetical protein